MNILSYTLNAFKHYRKFGMTGIKIFNSRFSKKDSVLEVSIPNVRHPLYLRTNTSDVAIFEQIFFLEDYKYRYNFNPEVILDCGANIGMSAVYYKNAFPEAKIISIEPDAGNFEMLKKNTASYADIECLQMGLWNKPAFLEINNRRFGNNSGFMVEEVPGPTNSSMEAISIPEIMKRYKLDRIDILKMDIEGSEAEVFGTDTHLWLPYVKMLVIEIHDSMKPGCAKSVFSALNLYDYNLEYSGESFFCRIGNPE